MHNGHLSHLTSIIRMYKLHWAEGYSYFRLVTLKCDCADVDLIWGTLLTYVWMDGASNSVRISGLGKCSERWTT